MKQIIRISYTATCIALGVYSGVIYSTHSTICKQSVLKELHANAAYNKQLVAQLPEQQTTDFLTELTKGR